MRLGAWWFAALTCAGGCLTTNPALTDTSGDTEGDETTAAATSAPTGSPETTETPGTSTTSGLTESTSDPDTTATQGSGTTSVGESGTPPAGCGGGNVCAPEVPEGWDGPLILAETLSGDRPPSCPDAYRTELTVFRDLQDPPAECSCECGAAVGASCAPLTLEYFGTNAGCPGGADETFSIAPSGTCNTGPNYSTGRYWQVADPGVTDGMCTPSDSVMIPEVSWGAQSTLCGGASAAMGACADAETCVPGPDPDFESRLCVARAGEHTCPDGYGEPFIRYGGYADERNCSDCSCGDPTGDCTGSVVLRSSTDCSGAAPSLVLSVGGSCSSNVGGTVSSASASGLSVQNVSCTPLGGEPIGDAEPVDPYTVCCMNL